jgi:hypothetical protein
MCYWVKILSIIDEQFNAVIVLMPKEFIRFMLSFGYCYHIYPGPMWSH